MVKTEHEGILAAYPFLVVLPFDQAIYHRTVFVNPSSVQSKALSPHSRRSHIANRATLKPAIREWLHHNVGLGEFRVGPLREPVAFFFKDKAKAALFKLFWF